jgi:hypothetical protein
MGGISNTFDSCERLRDTELRHTSSRNIPPLSTVRSLSKPSLVRCHFYTAPSTSYRMGSRSITVLKSVPSNPYFAKSHVTTGTVKTQRQ